MAKRNVLECGSLAVFEEQPKEEGDVVPLADGGLNRRRGFFQYVDCYDPHTNDAGIHDR